VGGGRGHVERAAAFGSRGLLNIYSVGSSVREREREREREGLKVFPGLCRLRRIAE
jgi:hypothetical protein